MSRALLAEGGIARRAHARGVPDTAGRIEHGVVRDGAAVPDALIAPVRRGPEQRVVVSRRRIGIAHGRLEGGGCVVYRIEYREIVGAELGAAVNQSIGVHGGMAAI